MPAQHRTRVRHRKNTSKKPIFWPFILVGIFIILIVAGFVFFKINTKDWNGTDKFAFVYPEPGGDVTVTVLDPRLGEETSLTIPGDTQVDVARGYGTLRIKSVWQLGINEKINGALLAQTVTQNFHFPVMLWSSTGLKDTKKFIFSPGKTNISLSDRVLAGLFSMKVKGIDKTEIDLGKNQYLKKQNLTDGLPGFLLNGPISSRLTIFFSDNSFSEKNIKFSIWDLSGKPGLTDRIGEVLEVLGGKVVSVERQKPDPSLDCKVGGKDPDAVNKVARLFSCEKSGEDSGFDVQIRVGEKFSKRY